MDEDAAVTPADVTDPVLAHAARSGDIAAIRKWLLEGGDPNTHLANVLGAIVPSLLTLTMFDSRKLREDRSEIIRLLVAHGANVNVGTRSGGAFPMHLCRYPEETKLLIKLGADVNAINLAGNTPLIMVASDSVFGLALTRILVRHGADLAHANSHWDNDEERQWTKSEWTAEYEARSAKNHIVADFLADVRLAGGWKPYARAPRIELTRLRLLCARGRATPPQDPVLQRLFSVRASPTTTKSARLSRPLPKEVFWLVLAFWRSSCDVDDDAINAAHAAHLRQRQRLR